MNKSLIEILLDLSNREFFERHKKEIYNSATQRRTAQPQPPLTDDSFWSKGETTN